MGRRLYHLMRADFLERTRRYSFLIVLGVVVYGAYMFLPPNHSQYVTMQMDGHRGVYNSAWVGAIVSLLGSIYIALAGFYLVKNAILRDHTTGVGHIIAATPTGRLSYVFGKALSNLAVLTAMVVVLIGAAVATQLIRGEDTRLDLWALVSPFALITFPIITMIAALAVLFESVRFLRGGLGNVVYYGFWTTALILDIQTRMSIFGHGILIPSMKSACARVFPDYSAATGGHSAGIIFHDNGALWDMATFQWDGVSWTTDILLERLLLVGVAIGVTALAALFFNRFDSEEKTASRDRASRPSLWKRFVRRRTDEFAPSSAVAGTATAGMPVSLTSYMGLAGLENSKPQSRLLGLIRAELTLLLRRHGLWWKIVASGLIIGGIAAPIDFARQLLWPLCWIWPILLWSSMGTRGIQDRTGDLLNSSPRPLLRQLPAAWLAGVLVTSIVTGGMAVRLIINGNGANIAAWAVGVVFVPSMAFALGLWTGSGKLFEVLYLMVWYAGLVEKLPWLDYAGIAPGSRELGLPGTYLCITAVLFVMAVLGRRRMLR